VEDSSSWEEKAAEEHYTLPAVGDIHHLGILLLAVEGDTQIHLPADAAAQDSLCFHRDLGTAF